MESLPNRHIVFDCDGTILDVSRTIVAVYPGIPELLHRLEKADCALYLWTARDRLSTERYLDRFGLRRYFQDIRTASEVALKPNPQGLQEMLVGISPSLCVMVGDSWTDIRGASLFGCPSIGALWNPHVEGDVLKEFGAHALAATPSECYELILRLPEG